MEGLDIYLWNAFNQDWLSPEGQEELRTGHHSHWGQVMWCQTCPSTRILKLKVGQGLRWKEDGKVVGGMPSAPADLPGGKKLGSGGGGIGLV